MAGDGPGTASPPREASSGADGTLYFLRDSHDTKGLYSLDIPLGTPTLIGRGGVTGHSVGLTNGPEEGILIGTKPDSFLKINADGSGATDVGGEGADGLAFDGETFYAVKDGEFFTLADDFSRDRTLAAPPHDTTTGLAYCERRHAIYGISAGNPSIGSSLYRYDIDSDESFGLLSQQLGGTSIALAYVPEHDFLYAKANTSSFLYRAPAGGGSFSQVGNIGFPEGGGMVFCPPDPDGGDNWQQGYRSFLATPFDLLVLRQFRDHVLSQSKIGQRYVRQLYAQSSVALRVLLANRELIDRVRTLIGENRQAIRNVLNDRPGVIRNTAEIAAFFDAFAAKSPPAMGKLALLVKSDMLEQKRLGEPFLGFELR